MKARVKTNPDEGTMVELFEMWTDKKFDDAEKKLRELEEDWGLSVLLERLAFSRTAVPEV
jgi:hypothetical protein